MNQPKTTTADKRITAIKSQIPAFLWFKGKQGHLEKREEVGGWTLGWYIPGDSSPIVGAWAKDENEAYGQLLKNYTSFRAEHGDRDEPTLHRRMRIE